MKRVGNLYSDVCDINNIIDMTYEVLKSVRNKKKVINFENHFSEHIASIKYRLDNRILYIGKYNIFMISDPKDRIIMAQEIEDKIINHLIAKYGLVNVFENKYTPFMCATRVNKGTLYGVKLLKKYLNIMKNKYNNFYVLKIDIKKYFYNIDHNILKEILRSKIKDKDMLNILDSIIDSTNESYVNDKIKELKTNKINYLKEHNKLDSISNIEEIPLYKYNKGVALGCQTSQAFGVIFLYGLIHYIKEELHIKYVINYVDDIVIIHNDKEYLKYCLKCIKDILNNKYKLEINEKKTRIYNINEGIDFLGYRFIIKNNKVILKIRNRTKKNFIKRIKELNKLKEYYLLDNHDYQVNISSYKGLLKWGSCNGLLYKYEKRGSIDSVIDKYYKYRLLYSDYIIIIKCGIFYECLAKDALIMNNLFNYKLNRLSNMFKIGFPLKSLDKVISVLDKKRINYIVINDKIVLKEYKNNK